MSILVYLEQSWLTLTYLDPFWPILTYLHLHENFVANSIIMLVEIQGSPFELNLIFVFFYWKIMFCNFSYPTWLSITPSLYNTLPRVYRLKDLNENLVTKFCSLFLRKNLKAIYEYVQNHQRIPHSGGKYSTPLNSIGLRVPDTQWLKA